MEHPDKQMSINIKSLNEYLPEWRQKLDLQRGAMFTNETKNNGNKIAKWTVQSLLANADIIKIGFLSRGRLTPKNRTQHAILGVSTFKPTDLALQIDLNMDRYLFIF